MDILVRAAEPNCPGAGPSAPRSHRSGRRFRRKLPAQVYRARLYHPGLPRYVRKRRTPPADLAVWRWGSSGWGQPAQPDGGLAERRPAALPHHPVVSAHRPSTATKPGRHRRSRSPGGPKIPTGVGPDCGPYPGQPGSSCRRNRLAPGRANGYVWTFSTPTDRYFLRRGRNKEVLDEVLDESFSGVLVR